MNNEEVEDKNDLPAENGEGTAERQQSNESIKKSSNKKSKLDTAKKILKKAAGKHSLLAAIGPILFWIFVGIVILIIIIGLAMFLITMPGMVMEKLTALAKEIGGAIASYFGADSTRQIEDQQIYDVLDYLEQMGYDLKGFGFLTNYIGDTGKDNDGVNRSKEEGKEGKISEAESDFIFMYLISDNYVYTVKNFNLNTQGGSSNEHWYQKLWTGIKGAGARVLGFWTTVASGGTITNIEGELWGNGMIAIYYEGAGGIGTKGAFYGDGAHRTGLFTFEWNDIELDTNTLSIKRGFNNSMSYNLDGWTGRYGMPLEFLLSVHLATMMPDLAYNMATAFNTQVNILLHPLNNSEVIASYKTDSGKFVNYPDIEKALTGNEGRSWYEKVWDWFENLNISEEEANNVFNLGIEHATDCDCPKDEEGNLTGIGGNCKGHIKEILNALKDTNDYNYDTYIPYISTIENHWYRDVYFVADASKNFVTYDYEYEALLKERWTLYETYTNNPNDGYKYNPDKEGEYILYPIDENGKLGTNPYEGTKEEAEEAGIKLAKKAETIKLSDAKEDLNWHEAGTWGNKLTAYELGDTNTAEERVFSDEEAGDNEIKKKIYYTMTSGGNVVQTGEGQRTETNNTIKKMFLQNRYFRYDGSADTAEIITKLRNTYNIEYGSLDKKYYTGDNFENYKVEYENDSGEKEEYTVEQLSANVSLNQDSLNAFSMLENTHTLDADYIYRDFKELMVELGYFTKEELTDETPRLLQWLVPDIGSGGYPNRAIDKRENEYGTMIHSKGDIDANEKNKLTELINKVLETQAQANGNLSAVSGINSQSISGVKTNLTLDVKKTITSGMVKGLEGEKKPSEVSVEELLTRAREMMEEMQAKTYAYCILGGENSPGFAHTHELKTTYEESKSQGQSTVCCATYVSWVLQEVGLFSDSQHDDSAQGIVNKLKDVDGIQVLTEWSELEPGDLLFFSDTDSNAAANFAADAHVEILGENISGSNFTYYNAGHYISSDRPGIQEKSDWGDSHPYHFAVRLPLTGTTKAEGEPYVGYEGNEAVVSPVTGILLEYGTYTDEDKEGSEEYRTNVDLKYGPTNTPMIDEEGNPIPVKDKNPEEQEGGEIVADKVGYAKILVLDSEHYKKLEANTNSRWKNESESLIRINSNTQTNDDELSAETKKSIARYLERLKTEEQMDEEHENWSEIDKLIYGYKEFAEIYEKSGIAGNIVYIDGFVCEEPDENLAGQTEPSGGNEPDGGSNISEQLPEGDKLTLDSFKVKESELEAQKDNEDALQNKYERDDEYKLASKASTDKLNAESSVKEQAGTAVTIKDSKKGDDIIFIKEGTVIGRTMTDKELIEKIRKDPPHDYEYYRPEGNSSTSQEPPASGNGANGSNNEEENQDKVMGNYIRIIMRDLDDTVVENVEDYMKLDEGESENSTIGEIEQFMYWQAKEPEGFEYIINGQQSYSLAISQGRSRSDNPSDKYGHNYFVDDGGVGDSNLCPGIYVGDGSGKKIFSEVTGDTNIVQFQSYCTGEQLLDIYTKELEVQMETIRKSYPITESWEDTDTRLFGLMDVMYAGEGNFKIGTIDDVLLAGGTLTREDFLSNCTNENAFYRQNPEGFTRRRLCDWYMYSEGKFGHNLYDTKDTSDITERWEFKSETPFQDLMVDIEGAELVDM